MATTKRDATLGRVVPGVSWLLKTFVLSLVVAGGALPGAAKAASLKTLYSVAGSGDGAAPAAPVIDVGGTLYGTTALGGAYGLGSVYKIDPTTGTETVVHSFQSSSDGTSPNAALVGVSGTLYGTTSYGGTSGNGTIFKIDIATGAESVVYSFSGGADGAHPYAALTSVGNILYGTTYLGGISGYGTVFEINTSTGVEKVLHTCAGGNDAYPFASLINVGGTLYGTATGDEGDDFFGAVFKIDPATGKETLLHEFGATSGTDGIGPYAAMVDVGGMLYGTTEGSFGSEGFGNGTVFKIDPTTGAESVIYVFKTGGDATYPAAPLIAVGKVLYGTAEAGGTSGDGAVFSVNSSTGSEEVVYSFKGASDGVRPSASLLLIGGKLYGTTTGTASATSDRLNAGTVFAIDAAKGTESVVYSFSGPTYDFATEGLTNVAGTPFITASEGGSYSGGSVLKLNVATGAASTIYSFEGKADGGGPNAPVIDVGGMLYGTRAGAAGDYGSVFKLNPASGDETVVYSFKGGADGANPYAGLIDVSGTLYGTTVNGGASSLGTVFKINVATGNEAVVYSFKGGTDGASPVASLTSLNGFLYGTTKFGGQMDEGTIFKINLATGAETVAYTFYGLGNGGAPLSSLINVKGVLYGITSIGGTHGSGVVFNFNPTANVENSIYNFTGGSDGSEPTGGLVYFAGALYGTTKYTSYGLGYGSVFDVNVSTGVVTTLYTFTGGADGGYPTANLISIKGALYGGTSIGGAAGIGTIFRLPL